MQKIRWFFLVLCIILALILVAQNNETASVQFLVFEVFLPKSVLLLSSAAVGFLIGALMTASMLRSRKKAEKRKQAEIDAAKLEPKPAPSDPPSDPPDNSPSNPLLGGNDDQSAG